VNLNEITRRLAPHTETPGLDARVILSHILQKPQSWLLAHPEAEPTPAQAAALEAALRRLENGEPLPYVLGHWEFYGLDFYVTPDVLIPRPETELLIESVLAWVQKRSQQGAGIRCVDLCTGSGCIPITLASLLPNAEFVATDISPAALAIARLNAEKHGVGNRIQFVEADLFPESLSAFDLVTANPPYIPTEKLKGLAVYGREPTLALDGGTDGMDIIRRLLGLSKRWLAAGGALRVEIESGQGKVALETAKGHFPDAKVKINKDLAGLDRLLIIDTNLL
jgi:release factor glutamine methyltransferase